ncbi:MAG: hypothetical protein IKO41_18460 [Lachnospiraceae bacterium]|nr:hypothetical protein [Lachnospiraceae bacterium]
MDTDQLIKNAVQSAFGEMLRCVGGETVRQHLEKAAKLEVLRRRPLLSPEEVSLLYGIPVSTLSTWRSRDKGPNYTKLEGSVFYTAKQMETWIAANEITVRM